MYPRIINYGRTRIPVKKVMTSPTQTVVPSPTPSTPEGLLAQLTSGDPILTDPLDGSSKEQWKLFSSAQGTCKFENGTYHVIANNANNTSATQSACWNQSTSFHKDIILQAQYKLDKGDTAEFVLCAGELKKNSVGYVCTFAIYNKYNCYTSEGWYDSFDTATNLNTWYTVSFMVKGWEISVFKDEKFLGKTNGVRYKANGNIIGFATQYNKSGTGEVEYRNLKVWNLN